MPTSNIIKTLVFPTLNILPIIPFSIFYRSHTGEAILSFIIPFLLGVVLGGVVPIVLIIKYKLDTSEYLFRQIYFTVSSAVLCLLSWLVWATALPLYLPIVLLIVFFIINWRSLGNPQIAWFEEKIAVVVVTLATPLLLYIGFLLEILLAFMFSPRGFGF